MAYGFADDALLLNLCRYLWEPAPLAIVSQVSSTFLRKTALQMAIWVPVRPDAFEEVVGYTPPPQHVLRWCNHDCDLFLMNPKNFADCVRIQLCLKHEFDHSPFPHNLTMFRFLELALAALRRPRHPFQRRLEPFSSEDITRQLVGAFDWARWHLTTDIGPIVDKLQRCYRPNIGGAVNVYRLITLLQITLDMFCESPLEMVNGQWAYDRV